MYSPVPAPPRRPRRVVLRAVLAAGMAAAGGSYAVFGDQLVTRLAALTDRVGRGAGETAEDIRDRADAARLAQLQKSFDDLTAHREALDREVKALAAHRAAVAARLDDGSAVLRKVQAARTATPGAKEAIDRDAVAVLHRVHADEADLAATDAELRRLTEARDRLDRDVDRAGLAVRLRADELERRRASTAGARAYRDGTEIANQIVGAAR